MINNRYRTINWHVYSIPYLNSDSNTLQDFAVFNKNFEIRHFSSVKTRSKKLPWTENKK